MWVSAKAKNIFFDYTKDKPFTKTFDEIWNILENKNNLVVWRPPPDEIYKYCEQKIGLMSIIKKHIRVPYNTKCKREGCNYVINFYASNNDGKHCCFLCLKGNPTHGPKCWRFLYVPPVDELKNLVTEEVPEPIPPFCLTKLDPTH